MRVLVTGSEGSLMQWTIKHLLAAGHRVIGVDNFARYDDYGHTRVVEPERYRFEAGDLTDYDRTAELMANDIDVVINAAAMIWGVKGFHEHPGTILSNDLTVDRNVAEAARAADVERVVYISSSMVYERDDPPHREQDVWDSPIHSTDYGLSKAVGERYYRAFQAEFGLDYTTWRPFNVITPYELAEDEAGDAHVFADFIDKLLVQQQQPMEIFGDGEQVRCFTWIDEVAETIATASFAEQTRNEAYNLANPQPVTMAELARRIHAKGVERGYRPDEELAFDHVEIYDDDVDERVPAVGKAYSHFGWDPSVTLDEALDRCIETMAERGHLDQNE